MVGTEREGPTFEERLLAAQERRHADPATREADGVKGAAWVAAFRVGGELVAALAVALAIGWGLDRLLGTSPWIMIAFFPLGAAAGVLNVWRAFRTDGS